VAETSVGKNALSKMASRSEGRRIADEGKQLGCTDYMRPAWLQVKFWLDGQKALNFPVTKKEMLCQFEEQLEQLIRLREAQAEKMDLTGEEEAELTAWLKKRKTLTENTKQRSKYLTKLVAKTEFVERDRVREQ
jgi:hypothetical protein